MSPVFATRPEIRGTFGAVASTHWIATAVGMSMLERGGNAFDAAVATGFTLQIVEPHLNGPGGDVPIILQPAGAEQPLVICGQGVAPADATIEAYRQRGLKMIPGAGLLAAVVPGAFDGWMLLLRDYGTLTLAEVLEPAIGYARNGFPLLYRAAASISAIADHFREHWPESAQVWLPDDKVPAANGLLRTPAIADTYERILREARQAGGDRVRQIDAARQCFYAGFVAEAIDSHCRREFSDGGDRCDSGFLTGDDMGAWRASYEATRSYDYHGHTIHKTGPWGQGPVMLQALALLRDCDLAAMDPCGVEFVHTVAEALKLALVDRDVFYGDPDFAHVPLDTLLGDDYNATRRRLITDQCSHEFRPGGLPSAADNLGVMLEIVARESPQGIGAGEPTFATVAEQEGDTVHLDIMDRWGNTVSATPSGGWLQSSPAIAGLGFNLPTRAQMFWLDERLPSSLAPGKRPRTTLTPTLVTRDGAPCLALGSPGGDQQDQWSLIYLLRHIHHQPNLQVNMDLPMFHTDRLIASFYPRRYSDALMVEGRFDPAVLTGLEQRGHQLQREEDWSLGRLCATARGNGSIRAAATARGMQALAVGR